MATGENIYILYDKIIWYVISNKSRILSTKPIPGSGWGRGSKPIYILPEIPVESIFGPWAWEGWPHLRKPLNYKCLEVGDHTPFRGQPKLSTDRFR